jgi:hypothetical protein
MFVSVVFIQIETKRTIFFIWFLKKTETDWVSVFFGLNLYNVFIRGDPIGVLSLEGWVATSAKRTLTVLWKHTRFESRYPLIIIHELHKQRTDRDTRTRLKTNVRKCPPLRNAENKAKDYRPRKTSIYQYMSVRVSAGVRGMRGWECNCVCVNVH